MKCSNWFYAILLRSNLYFQVFHYFVIHMILNKLLNIVYHIGVMNQKCTFMLSQVWLFKASNLRKNSDEMKTLLQQYVSDE